ncbi:ras-related protein Rab-38-like [Aethina tumida]|uniref:ras-related protein Rab-38-like n=1 Tax=Aethina tumida TaxID=116153 RepID=UPI002147A3F3|nr:ras-related protein Rab-38-like [Aethina tumida]
MDKNAAINECTRKIYKNELNYKFVIIGDYGVGKTSIINRYVEGEISERYHITIGSDFKVKTLELSEDTQVCLQIWDIAGHEKFNSLTGVFYRHARAAAIVFDLTRPETFQSVDKWLSDLRRKTQLPGGCNIPVVLLANKGDIRFDTIPPEICEYCKRNDILAWFITSAKTNQNLDEAISVLINAVYNHIQLEYTQVDDNDAVQLNHIDDSTRKKISWKCFNI